MATANVTTLDLAQQPPWQHTPEQARIAMLEKELAEARDLMSEAYGRLMQHARQAKSQRAVLAERNRLRRMQERDEVQAEWVQEYRTEDIASRVNDKLRRWAQQPAA